MSTYQITAVRLSNSLSARHEHITHVRLSDGSVYTVPDIIGFIGQGHVFIVSDGFRSVGVHVVPASGLRHAYIQTYADGVWTDNLLALPRF